MPTFICNFYNIIVFITVSAVENLQKPRLTFEGQRYKMILVIKLMTDWMRGDV